MIMFMFVAVGCWLLAVGCKTVRYVPVPEVHTKVEKLAVHDTVMRDRWHDVYKKGDTVVVHDSVVLYRSSASSDTVVRVDSVTVVDEASLKEKDARIADLERENWNNVLVLSLVVVALLVALVVTIARRWRRG